MPALRCLIKEYINAGFLYLAICHQAPDQRHLIVRVPQVDARYIRDQIVSIDDQIHDLIVPDSTLLYEESQSQPADQPIFPARVILHYNIP